MGCHRDTFYEVRKAFKAGGVANVPPSSANPTRPYTANTVDEPLAPKIPEDVAVH